VTGRDIELLAACAGTAACAALSAMEYVRLRRGRLAWHDVITVSFALYFGLLSVIGWAAWLSGTFLVIVLGRDWWDRKGKRAARELGLKSRARLAAVVEKAREAGSPLPEGAGV
jgi:hypothetical protein